MNDQLSNPDIQWNFPYHLRYKWFVFLALAQTQTLFPRWTSSCNANCRQILILKIHKLPSTTAWLQLVDVFCNLLFNPFIISYHKSHVALYDTFLETCHANLVHDNLVSVKNCNLWQHHPSHAPLVFYNSFSFHYINQIESFLVQICLSHLIQIMFVVL